MDTEASVRAMVFNHLCDATSKLGLLRWLQTTWLPGVDATKVTHQRLLRTMAALQAQADAVAALVSRLLRPLIDQRLSVVFDDLTTIRAEGLSEQPGELRRFGPGPFQVRSRSHLAYGQVEPSTWRHGHALLVM